MSPLDLLRPEASQPDPRHLASLADPHPSLLARYLESRLKAEERPAAPRLPGDTRPILPHMSLTAMMVYAHRQVVNSYPLIYTTMALAHPN
ncbi:MAG: hypothetical protein LDL07_10295 [Desulfarculus sp.]|nr:hypothetical protein [Desulfarculus sp.]